MLIFIFSSKACSAFLQSHPQDTLCISFQANWRNQVFRLKFVQKMDLGLKFEKTNIEIRINIFEILCVYVLACQFSGKTNSFDFFSPNLPKNGFRIGNSENYCRNNNQHPQYTMCANFQSKWTTLDFSAQICPEKDLGLETEKRKVGIRIDIVETLCVPTFRQTGQLWVFRSEFAQKWI